MQANCAACKDDDFGKAFCQALGDSMCSTSPCTTCPSDKACGGNSDEASPADKVADETARVRTISLSPTPGDSHSENGASPPQPTPPQPLPPKSTVKETMPASEAWRTLKAHPHIAFADLAMLADVVARRTKCSGPFAVIHPPPGATT